MSTGATSKNSLLWKSESTPNPPLPPKTATPPLCCTKRVPATGSKVCAFAVAAAHSMSVPTKMATIELVDFFMPLSLLHAANAQNHDRPADSDLRHDSS